MASSAGQRQERYLFDYLKFQRCCALVIEGDAAVRGFLGMDETSKCADAIGLHQPLDAPGARRITVAESKGTDMNSAVEQLGNAAAGIFEKFGRETSVNLLLMVRALVARPSGSLSPGQGYHVEPLQTGRNKFTLQESMGGPPLRAKPTVTYPDWARWYPQVALLPIVVLVLNDPPS